MGRPKFVQKIEKGYRLVITTANLRYENILYKI